MPDDPSKPTSQQPPPTFNLGHGSAFITTCDVPGGYQVIMQVTGDGFREQGQDFRLVLALHFLTLHIKEKKLEGLQLATWNVTREEV